VDRKKDIIRRIAELNLAIWEAQEEIKELDDELYTIEKEENE